MTSQSQASQIVQLKDKVKELESQVADYKGRLDALRKAKNTTVIKRDREVLEVGAPNLGLKRDTTSKDNVQVEKLQQEIEALKKKYETKATGKKVTQKTQSCNHEEEIKKLLKNIEELESKIAVLVIENEENRAEYENLLTEMSIKEAEWCEKEEQLNLKLKQNTFGDKYAEWMAKTEAKIQELENTNELLRKYLKDSGRGLPENLPSSK